MTAVQKYRRLPGRSGVIVRNSLWIQDDHVLRVRRYPFSEEYRRYYFNDIQSIVLTELPNAAAYVEYAIAAILMLATALLALTLHFVWAGVCGVAALLTLWLGLRSRNCACCLSTMVSTEELPSLRRRGAANKALAILRSEIQRAQGEVAAETVENHRSSFPAAAPAAKTEVPHYSGFVHWILFALVILRGVIAAIMLSARLYGWTVSMAGSGVSAGVLLMALIAAIKQYRTDLSRAVRWLVYTVFAWYALSTVGFFSVSIYIGVIMSKNAPRGTTPTVDPSVVMENPYMRYLQFSNIAVLLVIGCIGLVLLWRHVNVTRTPPRLASESEPLG
jgi:hypothetical protein